MTASPGPGTADEGQTARLDVTTIFPTTRTPSRLLVVRSSDETNQHRKNNGLQNHHRVVRRTFFVLTVIVRTNLLMTPSWGDPSRTQLFPISSFFTLFSNSSGYRGCVDGCCSASKKHQSGRRTTNPAFLFRPSSVYFLELVSMLVRQIVSSVNGPRPGHGPDQGHRSPRLKVMASNRRMLTGSSSFAVPISTHSPSRSSNASSVRSGGSTSYRWRTPDRGRRFGALRAGAGMPRGVR